MNIKIKKWFLATRPWSFSASAIPCLVAISYIYYIKDIEEFNNINWVYGTVAFIAVIIFQSAGNLYNDYFDYKKKVDRKETTLSSRILVDNIFTAKQIFNFASILLIIGIIIGIILCVLTSWKLIIIGILGVLSAIFYNKAKYIALGDLCIFICYGLLIALGTALILTEIFYWKILLINIPLALLIVGILHANNTRDINNDIEAGITTMAILLNLQLSKIYFVVLIVISYLFIIVLCTINIFSYYSFVVFLSLPIAINAIIKMLKTNLSKLKNIQNLSEIMSKFVLIFGLLLCIANVLGKLF